MTNYTIEFLNANGQERMIIVSANNKEQAILRFESLHPSAAVRFVEVVNG
jgi:hypothetical protein